MIETFTRLFRARTLVAALTRRDLAARYRGGALGFLWSVVNPLLLLAVYAVVFTHVFAPRADVHPYAVFLFSGILAWNFLSASLLDAAETFRANGPLLRKVIVPPEIFPAVSVASQACHWALALPVLAAAIVAARVGFGGRLNGAALQFLPIAALLVLAVAGLALLVAALSVHFRDMRDLLGNLLTLAFFATPIVYPLAAVPVRLRPVLWANPATPFFEGIHDSLFFARPVAPAAWAGMAAWTIAFLVLGGAVFARLRDSIAEEA